MVDPAENLRHNGRRLAACPAGGRESRQAHTKNGTVRIAPKTYELRPALAADSDFVYRVKKAALGRYVEETWGWNEAEQRAYHAREFNPRLMEVISVEGQAVGTLQVTRSKGAILLDAIYLLPRFQRQGIGTSVMLDLMAEADRAGLPIRLHVLKVNPARNLYERLGFRTTGETDHYYLMERRRVFSERPV
jgi:ribosomal protein S18 acetylase RimI-like enzyme